MAKIVHLPRRETAYPEAFLPVSRASLRAMLEAADEAIFAGDDRLAHALVDEARACASALRDAA